jgi:DNA-binding beta-propeller fold protein YncE
MFALLAACAPAAPIPSPAPAPGYIVYVASESADVVSRIRFVPGEGAEITARRPVGINPVETEGPHGVAVAPDGAAYYVTVAHGTPFGELWKISTATDEVLGRATLGFFAATVAITPDGQYAFVSNFNLHGDHVPSSISKVFTGDMTEVARTETCIMPHGSRINAQGTRHYSTCMMDQLLVELDVASAEISRLFSLAPGREGSVDPTAAASGHEMHAPPAEAVCSPTWAQPSVDGTRIYVACNGSDEIVEIDTANWRITSRYPTGDAPYNLATTPDGRYLLVTLKNRTAPATEVIALPGGETVARVAHSAVLPHGVAVSADSRYAFVSIEGVGSDPGVVEVIDLVTFERVASVDVAPQAGGIDVVGSTSVILKEPLGYAQGKLRD